MPDILQDVVTNDAAIPPKRGRGRPRKGSAEETEALVLVLPQETKELVRVQAAIDRTTMHLLVIGIVEKFFAGSKLGTLIKECRQQQN